MFTPVIRNTDRNRRIERKTHYKPKQVSETKQLLQGGNVYCCKFVRTCKKQSENIKQFQSKIQI